MASVEVDDVPRAEPVFIRSAYNYDMDFASDASGLFCADVTKTQQQFKEEADINTIVRRFGLTGELPNDFNMPESADIVGAITDYHTAMNMILEADHEFMRMPGELRARFQNDPQRLIDFLEDAGNRDEAVKLGLIQAPAAPAEPLQVSIVTPPGGTVTT